MSNIVREAMHEVIQVTSENTTLARGFNLHTGMMGIVVRHIKRYSYVGSIKDEIAVYFPGNGCCDGTDDDKFMTMSVDPTGTPGFALIDIGVAWPESLNKLFYEINTNLYMEHRKSTAASVIQGFDPGAVDCRSFGLGFMPAGLTPISLENKTDETYKQKELTDEDIEKTLTPDQEKAIRILLARTRRHEPGCSGIMKLIDSLDANQTKLMNKMLRSAKRQVENLQYLKIRKIIYNNPATIVTWWDGDTTVVKVAEGQEFSEYFGLLAAIGKRIYETNGEIERDIRRKKVECKSKKEPKAKTKPSLDQLVENISQAAISAADALDSITRQTNNE